MNVLPEDIGTCNGWFLYLLQFILHHRLYLLHFTSVYHLCAAHPLSYRGHIEATTSALQMLLHPSFFVSDGEDCRSHLERLPGRGGQRRGRKILEVLQAAPDESAGVRQPVEPVLVIGRGRIRCCCCCSCLLQVLVRLWQLRREGERYGIRDVKIMTIN